MVSDLLTNACASVLAAPSVELLFRAGDIWRSRRYWRSRRRYSGRHQATRHWHVLVWTVANPGEAAVPAVPAVDLKDQASFDSKSDGTSGRVLCWPASKCLHLVAHTDQRRTFMAVHAATMRHCRHRRIFRFD